MSQYLPLYLPYALNTFAEYADKMLPYLNQSSVKVPSSDSMETVARNLGSYGSKLVNRFWEDVYFKPHCFKRDPNAGSSFFTDNYLRCVDNDYNGQLGTVKVEKGHMNMNVVMPVTIDTRFIDGRGEVSAFALTPWLASEQFRNAYIEAVLTYYPVDTPDQYEALVEKMKANTQLFILAGTAKNQLSGFSHDMGPQSYRDHVFHKTDHVAAMMMSAFADSIANKIVEGSAESIKSTCASVELSEEQQIDAVRGSLFNLSSAPLVLEKAIRNFVEQRAYAIGSPMFSRDTFHCNITQSAFAAFKIAMKSKFTDSELSRIFFQAGGARFEIQEFDRALTSLSLNLVWVGKNEQGAPTIYPSFVQKTLSRNLVANIRSTDVSTVGNSSNYDSEMKFKALSFMDPHAAEINIGLAYNVKIAEFFKAETASEA